MGKKIVSFVLFILSLLASISLTLCVLLKINLREDKIVSYIKGADFSFIADEATIIGEELISQVEDYFIEIEIPKDTIKSVLNSEATKDFVGKYAASVLSYLIYETDEKVITDKEVLNLVTENMPIIETALTNVGLTLTPEEEDKIMALAKEHASDVAYFFPSAKELLADVPFSKVVLINNFTLADFFNSIRLITSIPFLLIGLLITSILLFLLWLINKGMRVKYFKTFFFIYALFFILGEIILGTVVKEFLMEEVSPLSPFINYIINEISKEVWLIILISLGLSFGISRIKRKEEKNEKISNELCSGNGSEEN